MNPTHLIEKHRKQQKAIDFIKGLLKSPDIAAAHHTTIRLGSKQFEIEHEFSVPLLEDLLATATKEQNVWERLLREEQKNIHNFLNEIKPR